ncbi:hypothetical protein KA082_01665 [Candidatus Woesebacteria bacterium]|nr:hypothetical protein [Candidatus Woesebacteria bacterium]
MLVYIAQRLAQFGPGLEPPVDTPLSRGVDQGTTALTSLEAFISQILGILTVVSSTLFVVNFMLAAVSWVTAGGDSGKIQKARDAMIQNTIGLIIVVGAYAIIGLVGSVVGLDLLNPAKTLGKLIP